MTYRQMKDRITELEAQLSASRANLQQATAYVEKLEKIDRLKYEKQEAFINALKELLKLMD